MRNHAQRALQDQQSLSLQLVEVTIALGLIQSPQFFVNSEMMEAVRYLEISISRRNSIM